MRLKIKGLAARLYYSCPEKLYHAHRPGCGRLTRIATATCRLAPGCPNASLPQHTIAAPACGSCARKVIRTVNIQPGFAVDLITAKAHVRHRQPISTKWRLPQLFPGAQPGAMHRIILLAQRRIQEAGAHFSGEKAPVFCWQLAISSWHLADLFLLPSPRGVLNGYTR